MSAILKLTSSQLKPKQKRKKLGKQRLISKPSAEKNFCFNACVHMLLKPIVPLFAYQKSVSMLGNSVKVFTSSVQNQTVFSHTEEGRNIANKERDVFVRCLTRLSRARLTRITHFVL